jgi:hypothetical protein
MPGLSASTLTSLSVAGSFDHWGKAAAHSAPETALLTQSGQETAAIPGTDDMKTSGWCY